MPEVHWRVPSTPDEWNQYDVVILGNDVQNLLDRRSAQQLSEFVSSQGGHVVFARGPCCDPSDDRGKAIATALQVIEPVVWDDRVWRDVQIRVTPGAIESSWMAGGKLGMDPAEAIRQLPGLRDIRGVRQLKPATRVLAQALVDGAVGAQPAIVAMFSGRGQVAALLGHDTWRWSLRPPTDEALISFYDTFWSNLVRWLVMGGDFQPGQQAALSLSRQSLQLSDHVEVEVAFKEAAAARAPWRVLWTDSSGQIRDLSLRRIPGRAPRFRTTVTPTITGVHRFQLLLPSMVPAEQLQKLNVYDVNLERLETGARPAKLKALAEISGGRFLDPALPEELGRIIERQQSARQIPPEPQYVWDQAGIMVLLLMWMGGEWLLRRLIGLI